MSLSKTFPVRFRYHIPRKSTSPTFVSSGLTQNTTSYAEGRRSFRPTRSRSASSIVSAEVLLRNTSTSSLPTVHKSKASIAFDESCFSRSFVSCLDDDRTTSLTELQRISRSEASSNAQDTQQISAMPVSIFTMTGDRIDLKIEGLTSLEHLTVIAVKQKLAQMWDARVSELKLLHPDDAMVFSDDDQPFALLTDEGKNANLLRSFYSTTFLNVRLHRGFARGMKLEANITLSEGQQYVICGKYKDPKGIHNSVPYQVSGLFQVACASSMCGEGPAMDLHLAGGGYFSDLLIFEDGTLRVKPDKSICSTFTGPNFFRVLETDSFKDSELCVNPPNGEATRPMFVRFATPHRLEEATQRRRLS